MPQWGRRSVVPPNPEPQWPDGDALVLREAGAQEKAIPLELYYKQFRGIALAARPDGAEPAGASHPSSAEIAFPINGSPRPQEANRNDFIVHRGEVKSTPVPVEGTTAAPTAEWLRRATSAPPCG